MVSCVRPTFRQQTHLRWACRAIFTQQEEEEEEEDRASPRQSSVYQARAAPTHPLDACPHLAFVHLVVLTVADVHPRRLGRGPHADVGSSAALLQMCRAQCGRRRDERADRAHKADQQQGEGSHATRRASSRPSLVLL